MPRSYTYLHFGQEEKTYALGPTQAGKMVIELKRGSGTTWATYFSQTGVANITLLADDFEDSADEWSDPPRVLLQDEAGRVSHGPNSAMLFKVWERSAVGASTALTLFSLKRDDDEPIHDNVRASRVVNDAAYQTPFGSIDLNTLQTVLWAPGELVGINEMPSGESWRFVQPTLDLSPAHTAWLYVPTMTKDDSDEISQMFTGPGEDAVKLTTSFVRKDTSTPSHVAAHSPLTALRPGQAGFDSIPGRTTSADGQHPRQRRAPGGAGGRVGSRRGRLVATARTPATRQRAGRRPSRTSSPAAPARTACGSRRNTRAAVVNKIPRLKSAAPTIARLPH